MVVGRVWRGEARAFLGVDEDEVDASIGVIEESRFRLRLLGSRMDWVGEGIFGIPS